MVARGWSEAQKRAYLIADNKLTENGGWDQASCCAWSCSDLRRIRPMLSSPAFRPTRSTARRAGHRSVEEWAGMPAFDQTSKWRFQHHRRSSSRIAAAVARPSLPS